MTRTDKNGEAITNTVSSKTQFIDIADLWQAHYQILLIIFLKEFIKLNGQTVISAVLNTQNLKMV